MEGLEDEEHAVEHVHEGETPADDVVGVREGGVHDPEGVDGQARDEEAEGEADEEAVGQGLGGVGWLIVGGGGRGVETKLGGRVSQHAATGVGHTETPPHINKR